MIPTIRQKLQELNQKYRLYVFRDVLLFMLITLAIHYSFRYWAGRAHYWPVRSAIEKLESEMTHIVYHSSAWFVEKVLKMNVTRVDEKKTMYFSNSGYILVNRSCSGFKQILQFVLLMMLFPGSLRNKLWFIPLGVLVVHLTNLFRVIGLSVIVVVLPQHWNFSHDYIFRPLFYVVIFLMWVWWVEKLAYPGQKTSPGHTPAKRESDE